MNTHARPSALLPAADAPDGPARRRWTLAELEHMVAAGVIAEDERIELIDGEVVAMSPKGRWHEIVRNALALHWSRKSSTDIGIATETPLQLAPKTSPESDIIIYPASLVAPDVRGDTVLLVVEIADSSISYDLKIKAPI